MSSKLIHQERLVYQEIKLYLNKNRCFELNNVIPYIKTKLDEKDIIIDDNTITSIISSFSKRKIIVEGSNFLREDVLTVKKRKIIFDYIVQTPGINYSNIVEDLNFNNHIVRWHLNILLIFDFIYKVHIDDHNAYFDSEFNYKEANELPDVKNIHYQ